MKRFFLLNVMLCLIAFSAGAQAKELRFEKNKAFKIVQFTDIHYIHENEASIPALENINEILDTEKPDLVILTGDLIYGKPAEASFRAVLDPMEKRNIPFAITFGNHDDEQGLSREELLEIARTYSCNLTSTTEGIYGVSNFILPILGSDSDKTANLIYCFDSNSYSKIEGLKGYDWVRRDQIEWYCRQSSSFTESNNGKAIVSLAFMHIPLPEYGLAAIDLNTHYTGTRMEPGGFPKLNSGLFTAIKEMGDIKAIFSGHDHDNDYVEMYHGIALSYGRYSGGNTVYNNLHPNGARVIELTENSPSIRSYISLRGGAIIQDLLIPDFFTDKK